MVAKSERLGQMILTTALVSERSQHWFTKQQSMRNLTRLRHRLCRRPRGRYFTRQRTRPFCPHPALGCVLRSRCRAADSGSVDEFSASQWLPPLSFSLSQRKTPGGEPASQGVSHCAPRWPGTESNRRHADFQSTTRRLRPTTLLMPTDRRTDLGRSAHGDKDTAYRSPGAGARRSGHGSRAGSLHEAETLRRAVAERRPERHQLAQPSACSYKDSVESFPS
jgi:hypothetical protein